MKFPWKVEAKTPVVVFLIKKWINNEVFIDGGAVGLRSGM